MRLGPRVLAPLIVLSILAGCTSDGYLGEIDEKEQARASERRAETLWRAPAASHPVQASLTASSLSLGGDLAPVALSRAPIAVLPAPALPGPGEQAAPPVERLALENVVVEGARGWILVEPAPSLVLLAQGGSRITLSSPHLRADESGLRAMLGGSDLVPMELPPFGCWDEAHEGEAPECAAWRDARPPPAPDAYANHTRHRFPGLLLPAQLALEGADAVFHGSDGASRALAPGASVDAADATLVALSAPGGFPPFGPTLAVALDAAAPFAWEGNLTVDASRPSGSLAFPDATRELAPFQEVALKLRGEGAARLSPDASGWRLEPFRAEAVSLVADGVHRIAASMRLLPDVIDARGPAGNITRVKLILAETSGGADAELDGYRINASTKARYVGAEPFAMTEELVRALDETEAGFATPFVLMGVGLALPFVALVEAFAAFFQALFPPSLDGMLEAGSAQLLTFELLVPEAPQEVEILIEAENAEPVRAKIHLAPE